MDPERVRQSYDAVAEAYAERYFGELAHKPFDRWWLDRVLALTRNLGPVCDMGCGPGHIARYLAMHGADAFGVDLSEGQVQRARQLNPGIPFQCDNMLNLTLAPASLGGIAAFYAIVHFTLDQAEAAFREFRRVLVPGGYALLSFHIGTDRVHRDEFLGHAVSMDFILFQPDDIVAMLEAAGLSVEELTMRYPYRDVEAPTKRAYILARAPL